MSDAPLFITLGAHVFDVHAKYVEEIPEGQGGALIEEIRVSPAGAAGGTAITMAKLGARTVTVGALGSDDIGDLLVTMLGKLGVETDRLARKDGVQTSATVLPIRPNGDRPALHVIGANASVTRDDVPWDLIEQADTLHLGGPEFMHELAPEILSFCREHGVRTSADVLADGWPELLDMIAPALAHVDWFLPNEDQAMKLTGGDDVEAAGRALIERGIGGCAITCGARGSVLVTDQIAERVPAFQTDVVDTTGCGDAFSAGFMRGLSLGRSPADAARLGSACASLVAQGLGSDAGEFDLARADEFAAQTPALQDQP
ncbi:MAG TPA: carbohydrate kinase family protein [Thermoleophilaceae bacterium]